MTFPPTDLPNYNTQADAAIGRQTDPPALGDGSVIGILKQHRLLLTAIAALAGAGIAFSFTGSNLNVVAAHATAAAPVYSEGTNVLLSTDLAGTLRTTAGGGGGGNPAGGWLDSLRAARLTTGQAHVGRATVDSILANYTHTGRVAVDSVLANMTHIGRVTIDSQLGRIFTSGLDTLQPGQNHVGRITLDSILANQTHIGRTTIDSILANQTHVGRVAVDSILANQTHIGRVNVDTLMDKATFSTGGAIGAVQLGSSTGKTNVLLTGTLVTTAVTADQVVLTRTVTGGKTFYLQYVDFEAFRTAVSVTGAVIGQFSLETPSGTKVLTHSFSNPTIELDDKAGPFTFAEPVPVAAGVVVRCVTTPAATTSTTWICNFGGYEK